MTVPVQNVYYLLCYAWEMWEEGQRIDVSGESFESLPELLVHVLNIGVAHLLRRGLDRLYIRKEEELTSPRGKLEVSATIKQTLMLRSRIDCVYDDLSHDVLHNQIIKATLARVARCHGLDSTLRDTSVQLFRRLHEITDIELTPTSFARTSVYRQNRFYAFLIEVCRVIVATVLIDSKTGQTTFREFLHDERTMARLFERFVRNFYRREQTEFKVSARQISWMDVSAECEEDCQLLPLMKTDVTLESDSRMLVIDTKYYVSCLQVPQYGKPTIHSGNLYQLFTYLENLQKEHPDGPTIEGMLLYPVVGKALDLSFEIHGHPVRIATLNLNQHWTGIKNRLLELID